MKDYLIKYKDNLNMIIAVIAQDAIYLGNDIWTTMYVKDMYDLDNKIHRTEYNCLNPDYIIEDYGNITFKEFKSKHPEEFI